MINSLFDVAIAVSDWQHWDNVGALSLAGVLVVAAHVFSTWTIDSVRESRSRREHFCQKLQPVLDAANDLLSRILDIFVVRHEKRHKEILLQHELKTSDRIEQLTPSNINRLEMAAYRLIRLLSLIEQFRRNTSEMILDKRLFRSRYFLLGKIPMVLRGNIYNTRILSSEKQEEIAVSFLTCGEGQHAYNISVGQFCKALRDKTFEGSLFDLVLQLFLVNTSVLTEGSPLDPENDNWKRMMVLSHLSIYLADLVQDFEDHSQWEEVRLFGVRMVRQWNSASTSYRYIYETDDMRTENYIASYPTFSEPLGLVRNIFYRFPLLSFLDLDGRASLLKRRIGLWIRGGRYRRRHQPKRVYSRGMSSRKGKEWYHFRLDKSLQELHNALLQFKRALW